MYAKPSRPVTLTKGKTLDAHDGFVDCWNWLASLVFNMVSNTDKKSNLEFDLSVQDNPKIKVVYT